MLTNFHTYVFKYEFFRPPHKKRKKTKKKFKRKNEEAKEVVAFDEKCPLESRFSFVFNNGISGNLSSHDLVHGSVCRRLQLSIL